MNPKYRNAMRSVPGVKRFAAGIRKPPLILRMIKLRLMPPTKVNGDIETL